LERTPINSPTHWIQNYDHGSDPFVSSVQITGGSKLIARISIYLKKNLCISGDDVLSIFGNDYESSLVLVDTFSASTSVPSNSYNTPSEIKEKNRRRFRDGPIYRIKNSDLYTKISFNFTHYECAELIDIYED
jgi:hypothetical protein